MAPSHWERRGQPLWGVTVNEITNQIYFLFYLKNRKHFDGWQEAANINHAGLVLWMLDANTAIKMCLMCWCLDVLRQTSIHLSLTLYFWIKFNTAEESFKLLMLVKNWKQWSECQMSHILCNHVLKITASLCFSTLLSLTLLGLIWRSLYITSLIKWHVKAALSRNFLKKHSHLKSLIHWGGNRK